MSASRLVLCKMVSEVRFRIAGTLLIFGAITTFLGACDAYSPLIERGNQIKVEIIKRYNAEKLVITPSIQDVAGSECFQVCEYFAYSTLPEVDRKLHDSEWALVFYNSAKSAYAILISNDGEIAYFRSPAPRTGGCISCDRKFRFGGLELRIE